MQGGRIEGLSEPQALSDAARKKYADKHIAGLRTYVDTKDGILTAKISDGDMFKSFQTKNMIKLKTCDPDTGSTQFKVLVLGEEREVSQFETTY